MAGSFGNLHVDEAPCIQSYFSEIVQSAPWYFLQSPHPTPGPAPHNPAPLTLLCHHRRKTPFPRASPPLGPLLARSPASQPEVLDKAVINSLIHSTKALPCWPGLFTPVSPADLALSEGLRGCEGCRPAPESLLPPAELLGPRAVRGPGGSPAGWSSPQAPVTGWGCCQGLPGPASRGHWEGP